MKQLRILLALFGVLLLGSLGGAGVVAAQSFHSGDNVTITNNQPIDSTLFVSGSNVNIDTDVNGDVICAGQTITISGTVHGDVICAGQTIAVNGKVDGDIRLAGQTVTVSAAVSGNMTIASQSFILEKTGSIMRDAIVAAATTDFKGSVGRDITAYASSLRIAGDVGRNVTAAAATVELASGAKVQGSVDYTSNNTLTQASGAVVNGQINQTEPTTTSSTAEPVNLFGFAVGVFLYWFIALLIIGMALVLLLPRILATVTGRASSNPWWPLLIGFIAAVCVPFGLFVLAVTFVGLPLAFIFGLVWVLILLLSGPFFAYLIGRSVLRGSTNPFLIMLMGIVILMILYAIPFINILTFIAATWIGTGMILQELFHRTPMPIYHTKDDTPKRVKATKSKS